MATEKEKAQDALNALRTMLKGNTSAPPHLEAISRYSGELRRNVSTLKDRITTLETDLAAKKDVEVNAERALAALRQQLVEAEKRLEQPVDPEEIRATRREKRLQRRQRNLDRLDRKRTLHVNDLPPPTVAYATAEQDPAEMSVAHTAGMMLNPIYAGLGKFPPLVEDKVWIGAAWRMLDEMGPAQFFVNLLYVLRQSFKAPGRYADITAVQYYTMQRAADPDGIVVRITNEMLVNPPPDSILHDDDALRGVIEQKYQYVMSLLELDVLRTILDEGDEYAPFDDDEEDTDERVR